MLGMCCVIYGRTIFSSVFAIGDKSEIGLYEEPKSGSLLGLRIGIILESFQMCGMVLLLSAFMSNFL